MLIKALLPLIAVFKYKYDGLDGKCFGKQIAQVYKGCKEEISSPQARQRQLSKTTEPATALLF